MTDYTHRGLLLLSPLQLERWLKGEERPAHSSAPDDLRIVAVLPYPAQSSAIEVVVESASFPKVAIGDFLPRVEIIMEETPDERPDPAPSS